MLGGGAFALLTDAGTVDLELVVLLRFMAVLKGTMALGAAALVAWRLRWPVRPATGVG